MWEASDECGGFPLTLQVDSVANEVGGQSGVTWHVMGVAIDVDGPFKRCGPLCAPRTTLVVRWMCQGT